MGEVLTRDWLQGSKKRVEAIVNPPWPQNHSEVRIILGSALFCTKFIPVFSTVSSPLLELTRMGKACLWVSKGGEAFDQFKALPTNAPLMAYFKIDAKNPPCNRCLPCWTWHNLGTKTGGQNRKAHTGQFITPAVSWVTWKTVLPVLEGSSSSTMGLSEILPLFTQHWLWDLYRS